MGKVTEIDGSIVTAGGGGTGTVTSVGTSGSLTGGTITTAGVLSLVNDNASPGNFYFYGTDAAGVKGFYNGVISPITIQNTTSLFSTGLVGTGTGSIASGAIFLGPSSGNAATNAFNSLFLLENAGRNATNASDSIFLGRTTGFGATDAFQAIFLGSQAGQSATDANRCTFIGIGAGANATNAEFSNIIGYLAGQSATNASNAIFFGTSAGIGATDAIFAIFIGNNSGTNAANGSFAIYIGGSSGSNAANAQDVIFIGTQAGSNDTVNTTGGETAVLIGRRTLTGGFTNSVLIGGSPDPSFISNTQNNQFMVADHVVNFRLAALEYVFPAAQAAGQLTNDGSGNLTWTPSPSGGITSLTAGTGISATPTNPITTTGTITANLSTGVSGGQTAFGGTGASESLTLSSTTNATKGNIQFGNSYLNETFNSIGLSALPVVNAKLLMISARLGVTNSDNYGVEYLNPTETFDASSGARNHYAGYFASVGSRSSGANPLNNYGIVAFAQSGTNNYAAYFADGNVGIGGNFIPGTPVTPTARLHILNGTTAAGTAPLKISLGGALMTTPEPGAVEAINTHIYWTDSLGARFQLDQQVAEPASQVVYGTGTGVTSDSNYLHNTTTGQGKNVIGNTGHEYLDNPGSVSNYYITTDSPLGQVRWFNAASGPPFSFMRIGDTTNAFGTDIYFQIDLNGTPGAGNTFRFSTEDIAIGSIPYVFPTVAPAAGEVLTCSSVTPNILVWGAAGGGATIYTGDGTISGSRNVDLAGNDLNFRDSFSGDKVGLYIDSGGFLTTLGSDPASGNAYIQVDNSLAQVIVGNGPLVIPGGSPGDVFTNSGGGVGTWAAPTSPLIFSTGLTNSSGTITANLSTGISGGQSAIGGTASGQNLTLSSTTNATKGKILFGNSAYDEANNRLYIGQSTGAATVDILAPTLSGAATQAGFLFTQTYNTSGVAEGATFAYTNTASANTSRWLRATVGGTEVFSVGRVSFTTGMLRLSNSNVLSASGGQTLLHGSSSGIGFYDNAGSISWATIGSTGVFTQTPVQLTGSLATSIWSATQTWNTTGNPTALFLNVTNTASGASSNLMDLQTSSVSRFKVDKGGNLTVFGTYTGSGTLTAFNGIFTGLIRAAAASVIEWNGSTKMSAPSNGVMLIQNNAATDFSRLQFGGTTSSFPAIKRTTTALNFRLADDSADCDITAARGIFSAPVRLPGYTVATLPAGTQGDTAFVTDALAPAFLTTVVGGGAVVTTVFYNGTNWVAQ